MLTSPFVSTNDRHLIRLCSLILKLEAQAHPPAWLKSRGSILTRLTSMVAKCARLVVHNLE
jgi:hypothetical protein